MSANAPQPRALEMSLVWAREAMTWTSYTNVVLYVLSLCVHKMRCGSHDFLGPNKIRIFKSRNHSCDCLSELSLQWKFRWHGFSQAPSATATEPHELPQIAKGGGGISKRTHAVVINNTMSYGHCVPCDALGLTPEKRKKRRDKVRFAFF